MKTVVLAAVSVLLAASCASMTKGPTATASLASTSGSSASGTVSFTQVGDDQIEVKVQLAGVPQGVHGFHIHEKGDCGDNGNAAGGHFNPSGEPHADPGAAAHHAGDFGNVTAAPDGTVSATFITRSITLGSAANSAVGRAVILHANPDDLTTQPTGNAGARIACGVVQLN